MAPAESIDPGASYAVVFLGVPPNRASARRATRFRRTSVLETMAPASMAENHSRQLSTEPGQVQEWLQYGASVEGGRVMGRSVG